MHIPNSYHAALAKVRAVFPEAMIAGGALRDLDNERPVKDVDIFVPHVGDFETAIAAVRSLVPNDTMWGQSPDTRDYGNWMVGDVAGVFDINDEALEYQLICLNVGADRVLPRIDFGICQIAWDGETVHRTDAYNADKVNERFTLIRCDDSSQYQRSIARFDRLQAKYPGWTLALDGKFVTACGHPVFEGCMCAFAWSNE